MKTHTSLPWLACGALTKRRYTWVRNAVQPFAEFCATFASGTRPAQRGSPGLQSLVDQPEEPMRCRDGICEGAGGSGDVGVGAHHRRGRLEGESRIVPTDNDGV